MTLNLDKTPRVGTQRNVAVTTAREMPGRSPQEICRAIAIRLSAMLGLGYERAYKLAKHFYSWARAPSDGPTKKNGPYINPAIYPPIRD